MTNAQIIFNESVALMQAGIIGTTGRSFEAENENGEKVTLYAPEPLHTFAAWKERGRVVKKGEHAKATFMIWKAAASKNGDDENASADGEQGGDVRMFMKKAFFFTFGQTEEIAAKA